MTSYLQRLFDRAAGLAARPATALTPSFSSRSPIAEADQPLLTPTREARGARNIAPPHVAEPRERAVSQSAAEPASRPAALEPIPPAPRAVPQQPLEPGAAREPLQPREAETSATPLQPSPMPAAAKAEARVVRPLEPLPLPTPDPLPGLTPAPREVAARPPAPVTRREIVA